MASRMHTARSHTCGYCPVLQSHDRRRRPLTAHREWLPVEKPPGRRGLAGRDGTAWLCSTRNNNREFGEVDFKRKTRTTSWCNVCCDEICKKKQRLNTVEGDIKMIFLSFSSPPSYEWLLAIPCSLCYLMLKCLWFIRAVKSAASVRRLQKQTWRPRSKASHWFPLINQEILETKSAGGC